MKKAISIILIFFINTVNGQNRKSSFIANINYDAAINLSIFMNRDSNNSPFGGSGFLYGINYRLTDSTLANWRLYTGMQFERKSLGLIKNNESINYDISSLNIPFYVSISPSRKNKIILDFGYSMHTVYLEKKHIKSPRNVKRYYFSNMERESQIIQHYISCAINYNLDNNLYFYFKTDYLISKFQHSAFSDLLTFSLGAKF